MMHFQTKAAAPVARWFLLAAMSLALSAGLAGAQTFTPRDESPEDFPAGQGRDETFYTCTACHGFKLVAAQGMNRRQWDDSINWMMEKHRMPPLDTKEREIVLNYLEATFPPRAPSGGGGFQNPFMKR
jgi:mono/diheme cytochrome c family protein